MRRTYPTVAGFQVGKGALNQEVWVASRSWKRQRNSLSPEPLEEHSSANTLILASGTHTRLLTDRTIR